MPEGRINPFSITKSADLSDEQIEDLWVDDAGSDGLVSSVRLKSLLPMFILGGKGSGKTHLMRYCSYRVQKLRFQRRSLSLPTGIQTDGYVGIYLLCSGLSANRFYGKGFPEDAWRSLFSYYVELWLSQELLTIAIEIAHASELEPGTEAKLCAEIAGCFDTQIPTPATLGDVSSFIANQKRQLDFEINNAAFTRKLNVTIAVGPGRLIFGLPRILSNYIPCLKGVVFLYQLDELENLSASQQTYVNSLVRDKEQPTSFKIGARLYGIKTRQTLSDSEELVHGSEFEILPLDERFRKAAEQYRTLAYALVSKRLEANLEPPNTGRKVKAQRFSKDDINSAFAVASLDWNSPSFNDLVSKSPPADRAHLLALRSKLEVGLRNEIAPQVSQEKDIEAVVDLLRSVEYPLLEKLNVLQLYQRWFRGLPLIDSAEEIRAEYRAFIQSKSSDRYATAVTHYRGDLTAQLRRENGHGQLYAGFPTFVQMSEGLPRALVTLLKHIFDWAVFNGETPFSGNAPISLDAQRRGVSEAADWFLTSMRKVGPDGNALRSAVDRLGTLFRINRFADKPTEISVLSFSANMTEASNEARRIVDVAVERSLLVDIEGGQKDKNSERVDAKLQLSKMLAPRWDLPVNKGGTAALSASEVDAVFCLEQTSQFEALGRHWAARMTAPYFGRVKRKRRRSVRVQINPDLFS